MLGRLLDNIVLFVFGRVALLDSRYAGNIERCTGSIVPSSVPALVACPDVPVRLASASVAPAPHLSH